MHPQVEMFRNRLQKNLRRLAPWAAERRVHAYRLYDRDIPEVGLLVDSYGAEVLLAEYARRAPRPDEEGWRGAVLLAVAEVCGVEPAAIHRRWRERQHGDAQYGRLGAERHEIAIEEGGHRFLVNLSDYLDTGLFLDHRDTRRLVGELSRGREVLNLFGYTGSFSVYAAGGGAAATTTVDLSNTYLDWAARNFALNRMDPERHRLLRADAVAFLGAARGPRYDLIVLDPPTFSNSKKMLGTLDVQRDHPALLAGALRLLRRGGTLVFSSNRRGLRLRAEEVPGARFADITERTIPRDFHDRRVHQCWLVEQG